MPFMVEIDPQKLRDIHGKVYMLRIDKKYDQASADDVCSRLEEIEKLIMSLLESTFVENKR